MAPLAGVTDPTRSTRTTSSLTRWYVGSASESVDERDLGNCVRATVIGT